MIIVVHFLLHDIKREKKNIADLHDNCLSMIFPIVDK